MKEDNKKFIDTYQFRDRVLRVMEIKNISMDDLYIILNEEVKYEISKNNIGIYIQRSPNTNFLIALCKALGVSADYLLGITDENLLNSGFDYKYRDKRYKKYECDEYFFYFYPTVSNTPTKVNVAKLSITFDGEYKAKLIIQTDENEKKQYVGKFVLSKDYKVGYINLVGVNIGEIVNLSFHDPVINGDTLKTELLVGAMLSVSTGDFKRAPVMSKFILSRHEIEEQYLDVVRANLMLNNKYIEIDEDSFKDAFRDIDFDHSLKSEIMSRLKQAFQGNQYYRFEEAYILNTIAKDYKLTFEQAMQLVNKLRIKSISNANCKINHKVDSRLFDYLKTRIN